MPLELPTLPQPSIFDAVDDTGDPVSHGYSGLQMHDFARCAVLKEREACARIAERFEPDEKPDGIAYASREIRKRAS